MLDILFAIHAVTGSVALLCGISAPFFRKTHKTHRFVGTIFFYSMLGLGLSGAIVALYQDIPLSLLNGLLVCYFVISARLTIKQTDKHISKSDLVNTMFIILLLLGYVSYAVLASLAPADQLGGFGWQAFIAFGSVALFCAVTDIFYIKRNGANGKARLTRHLWRMFFPLFMATAAFFLGQARLLPEPMRRIEFLVIPVAIVLIMMVIWMIRIKFSRSPTAN